MVKHRSFVFHALLGSKIQNFPVQTLERDFLFSNILTRLKNPGAVTEMRNLFYEIFFRFFVSEKLIFQCNFYEKRRNFIQSPNFRHFRLFLIEIENRIY